MHFGHYCRRHLAQPTDGTASLPAVATDPVLPEALATDAEAGLPSQPQRKRGLASLPDRMMMMEMR